jgi:hypothetical protein
MMNDELQAFGRNLSWFNEGQRGLDIELTLELHLESKFSVKKAKSKAIPVAGL